jgi:cobalt-zinc-cadmium efflux system outer membrane protein
MPEDYKPLKYTLAKTFLSRNPLLVFLASIVFTPSICFSMTFREALHQIETHEKPLVLSLQSQSLAQEARRQGSWGDPSLKVMSKNLPYPSLQDNKTPMSGLEIALSGTLPLSFKKTHQENSARHLSEAVYWQARQSKRELQLDLWKHVITVKKLKRQKQILEENLGWVRKIIDVSKNLYANGKVSQQAILELQIRKSELESQLINIDFELTAQQNKLRYLVGGRESSQEITHIPWQLLTLTKTRDNLTDSLEQSLSAAAKAKEATVQAKASSLIPDVTISLSYTKRANIDDLGDFVSISAQLPIPVSNMTRSDYRKAIYEDKAEKKRLANYREEKTVTLRNIEIDYLKLQRQIDILENESIKFARNARDITAKAYELGSETYIALLQSELKLQELLFKLSNLTANKELNSISYKFVRGETLHD